MLRVQPRWVEEADAEAAGGQEAEVADGAGGDGRCVSCGGRGESEEEGCAVGEDEDGKESDGEVFDHASFSRLLRKVSLSEAKEYSKMSYLCNIAYMIPRIQPKCLRRYNLWFVTSSVQEKARTNPDEKQGQSTEKGESSDKKSEDVKNVVPGSKEEKGSGLGINPFDAYQVMSTAASYLHSQAMGITPFGSRSDDKNDPTIMAIVNSENGEGLTLDEASFVGTTNSVTSMVAAKEETRQAVADDLNSSRSCPCEWFICDGDQSSTRYFVVQGSESIASWQANLLFEPIKFEILRELLPHSDQKRDKATFLLEVIEYIRFLQEKVQKYEASFPEWNQENAKILPWSNIYFRSFWKNEQSKGQIPEDALPEPSQFIRNGSSPGLNFTGKLDDNHTMVASAAASGAQDQAGTDHIASVSYRSAETPTNIMNNVTSQSQPQWAGPSGVDDCAVNNDTLNDQQLTIDEGTISLSSQYSQELLDTLTHALQSSGIDLSQASISVQINLGKRAVKRPAAGASSSSKELIGPASNSETVGHQLTMLGGDAEEFPQPKRHKPGNT